MSTTKEYLHSILSDLEKKKVQQFYDDDVMREAVKKVLLVGIYDNGSLKKGQHADPRRNFILSLANPEESLPDDILGQRVRAAWEGVNALESGFSVLADFKEPVTPKDGKENNAR